MSDPTNGTSLKHKHNNNGLDENEIEKNMLTDFEFVRLLNEDTANKLLVILAKKKTQAEEENDETRNDDAIVIFEKPHFGMDEIKSYLAINNEFTVQLKNDIYNRFCIFPVRPYSSVDVQLIYPATAAHIAKYSFKEFFFLRETAADYANVTRKFIESEPISHSWVYNILEHKTESERIVCEDNDPVNGFVLLPDMKWDGKTNENMYLLAIVQARHIRSIRDLDASHLPLLSNIYDKCMQAIKTKYDIGADKVRAYFHYQPTFYHLHVHFTHIKNQVKSVPERNHSMSTVIENLKISSDYYKKATLECPLDKNEALSKYYKDRIDM